MVGTAEAASEVALRNRGGNDNDEENATQPGLGTNLAADDTFTLFATGRFGADNVLPFTPAP